MRTAKNRTDELRPEYDLYSLPVRKIGHGRKSFGPSVVRLESDVAEAFPSATAVNEALRLFIKITKTMGLVPPEKIAESKGKASKSRRASRSRKAHAA